ncbi:MAG: hydrogenase maturation protease [Phycisphaerae bacterium]|nr:hydrogenase maturation protease [Phycisphaerae bacterium]
MSTPGILVAGIGNIFFGDDAFGSEVARQLLQLPRRDDVRVIDFGIRGLDLMYALGDGYEAVVLIDAVPRGEAPGTLFLLEPQLDNASADSAPTLDAHSMDPMKVLASAAAMGPLPGKILIVGCEPSPSGDGEPEDGMEMRMTPAVEAAIEPAVEMVQEIVSRLLSGEMDKMISVPQPP